MRGTGLLLLLSAMTAAAVAACGGEGADSGQPSPPAPAPTSATTAPPTTAEGPDLVDQPLEGITSAQKQDFDDGDRLFDLALREGDGLGPLYTRTACSACHDRAARGPGAVRKMSMVEADGFTPAADQSLLFGHTEHPLVAGGAKTPVLPPALPNVKVSTRMGPSTLGRGWIEAVADAEIERVEREQAARTDAIHGRINRVTYASEKNVDTSVHAHGPGDIVIGRFGVKARVGFLDDFTADALQGDMGITSPLRPKEIANPDGLADDAKPGVDVTFESVNKRAQYLRLVAIPKRKLPESPRGAELFAQVKCAACHVPSMKTRADYPVPQIAGKDAPLYSDILLHDMGSDLSDGLPPGEDGLATGREWKTPALIGLRFAKGYLHDSRAKTIDEAIRMHDGPGSQASESAQLYRALSDADRTLLLDFVGAL